MGRFSLVQLCEGECCLLRCPVITYAFSAAFQGREDADSSQGTSDGAGGSDSVCDSALRAVGGSMEHAAKTESTGRDSVAEGRLWVSSFSVVVELRALQLDVVRLHVRDFVSLCEVDPSEVLAEQLAAAYALFRNGDSVFARVSVCGWTVIARGSCTLPYQKVEIDTPVSFVLAMPRVSYNIISELLSASQCETSRSLTRLILACEKSLPFPNDRGVINVFDVIRIKPLSEERGRVVVRSDRCEYFSLHKCSYSKKRSVVGKVIRWEGVSEVASRRYLLESRGLELFLKTGRSVLFSFQTESDFLDIWAFLRNNTRVRTQGAQQWLSVVQDWQSGVLTNFHYLSFLNSAAGRTVKDLAQYPVFPWIVADYHSDTLDLTSSETFRDLSKPIGALNAERLQMFRDRMDGMEAEKYLYCTHYSTPAYVSYFLLRSSPEFSLCMQNGRYDHADRQFCSLSETWRTALNNPADVKELIPEFYQPSRSSFLLNDDGLDLGIRQDGSRVGDVVLPPWASSSRDCLRQLRGALESDYVSSRIHLWIDLIFGSKQRGEAAFQADNLFHPLCYGRGLDADDPQYKDAVEGQIREFGQVPKQLFLTDHVARGDTRTSGPSSYHQVRLGDGFRPVATKDYKISTLVDNVVSGAMKRLDLGLHLLRGMR